MSPDLARERVDYQNPHLLEDQVPLDPVELLRAWLDDAFAAKEQGLITEPSAVTVATARQLPNGSWQPTARIVLLKAIDDGLVFFTNYNSAKGSDLAANPYATLLAYWGPLFRQVRVEGTVAPVSAAESDAYFDLRPRGAQLGAWASEQSSRVSGLEQLIDEYAVAQDRFAADVPRPPHWGGYRLTPQRWEFWVGQPSRMHDRVVYSRSDGGWSIGRLAP